MKILAERIEASLDQLNELVEFFQPDLLSAVCDLANEYDNPKKRKYLFGMMEISCRRDREKATVEMPRNYRVPDRAPIAQLRKALAGIAG